MSPDLDFVLSYARGHWSAEGAGMRLTAHDLPALDRAVVAAVGACFGAARVAMRFDNDMLPRWLRQYQPHYCNYRLHVPATGTGRQP